MGYWAIPNKNEMKHRQPHTHIHSHTHRHTLYRPSYISNRTISIHIHICTHSQSMHIFYTWTTITDEQTAVTHKCTKRDSTHENNNAFFRQWSSSYSTRYRIFNKEQIIVICIWNDSNIKSGKMTTNAQQKQYTISRFFHFFAFLCWCFAHTRISSNLHTFSHGICHIGYYCRGWNELIEFVVALHCTIAIMFIVF